MTSWPTLPDPRETFIGEVFSVMREVLGSNVDGNLPVRHLLVRVSGARETVYVFDHDRLDLKRTKLAMTASRKIIAAGFDGDKRGKEEGMHNWILVLARDSYARAHVLADQD